MGMRFAVLAMAAVAAGTLMVPARAAQRAPSQDNSADVKTLVFELAAMYAWDAPLLRWAYDWAVAHGVGTALHLSAR